MTELQLGTGEVLSPVQADASIVRLQVEELLGSIREHETRLTSNYAQLGSALVCVQENHYWREWGYASWGSYIDFVCRQIGRRRAQVYNVLTVAQKLLPSISEDDLTTVGISKAMELARYVKQSGLRVPENLLLLAMDANSTVEQLHAAVLEELHEKCDEKGKWWNEWNFYATQEEKQEILDAIRVTMKIEPSITPEKPDHVIRKEVVLLWAREFQSTYAAEASEL